ncbi:hypothetical protein GCM10010347_10000 [Streptomyces cirratus]|uniref:Uncharacterized protein n=1 Tax=Streptomyces cirratus TaxID=68187 RepID=A0ABQ3EQT9_9ACTN|nr:hypothetical protein GCM10010347_10000 [Streptomyces cirratus]
MPGPEAVPGAAEAAFCPEPGAAPRGVHPYAAPNSPGYRRQVPHGAGFAQPRPRRPSRGSAPDPCLGCRREVSPRGWMCGPVPLPPGYRREVPRRGWMCGPVPLPPGYRREVPRRADGAGASRAVVFRSGRVEKRAPHGGGFRT